ncbi:MAG TPA: chemotaxis protein CheW [Falsiroseomonas sp.]|jgi:purine-binding chemotaxis protein CheW|nr:chemotaxis protein CheW [Falsiroseomonas sp.]
MPDGVGTTDTSTTVVVFALGAARCALRHDEVREVLPIPHLWRPPGAPRPLEGFLNLAGTAVPVIALARLLAVPEGEDYAPPLYRHLVLLRVAASAKPTALLVERVLDVARVPAEAIRPAAPDGTLNGCVEAEIDTGEGFIHLLAADRILLAQERAVLHDLAEAAEARLGEWGASTR